MKPSWPSASYFETIDFKVFIDYFILQICKFEGFLKLKNNPFFFRARQSNDTRFHRRVKDQLRMHVMRSRFGQNRSHQISRDLSSLETPPICVSAVRYLQGKKK